MLVSGSVIERMRGALHRFEDGLLAALLTLLLLTAVAQIVMRLFGSGIIWAEPVSRMGVLWLALLGALGATRQHRQIAIDAVPRLLPSPWRRVAWVLAQLGAAIITGLLAWYGWQMLLLEREAPVPFVTGIPSWVPMIAFPLGFGLMALRFVLAAFAEPPADHLPEVGLHP